jgi:5S rRNA maturation endonuclease (ribonuclease M5)
MIDIIHQKKVLAVEGKDDVNFLNALLKHAGITNFEVYEVGGKQQFKDKLPALVRMSGFSDVEVLAIIRDADNNAETAFESIRNILKKEKLKPPVQINQFSEGSPKIGIFIMPGNSDAGMLEDLCLKTVEDHPAMCCVESFIDCVSKLENPPNNIAKAKAQAFLAAMPKLVNSVGLGAQKGYWDFNSEELTDLKSFIDNLR